jgi:beta-glucanase (GH16 family)
VRASSWTKIFNENFTTSGLGSRWNYRGLGERQAGSDRLCSESSNDPAVVSVPGDGFAHLKVKKIARASSRCPYGEFYNANIGTEGNFAFKYGVFAARVKFQRQRGQHGGLWSQPQAIGGAEIDNVEYFGDGYPDGGLGHYVFWKDANGSLTKTGGIINSNELLASGNTWSNSFHVFSVEWSAKGYVFRVDGNRVWQSTKGVSQVDQYLILSLLTSGWELPKLDTSKLNPMTVDWVRVWQRP